MDRDGWDAALSRAVKYVLLFPANQFAFADRHDQGIDTVVTEGASEHRLQRGLVVYGVICDQDASRDHAGHQGIIAATVDFLFGIKEAEGDIIADREESQTSAWTSSTTSLTPAAVNVWRASWAFSSRIS
jgi:hypothetical protein